MSPALDSPTRTKPRNKLRKLSKRRPESIVSSVSPRASADSRRDSGEAAARQLPKAPSRRTPLLTPPDLSDAKWQEYVRNSGLLLPMDKSPHLQQTSAPPSPSYLIPEFAHLALVNPGANITAPPRHSTDEDLPPSPRSTLSSSSSSAMRRYAKTPVTRIGQLEGEPSPSPSPSPTRLGYKPSDVELIAEQYRALLDARSYEELLPAAEPHAVIDWRHDGAQARRQHSLDTLRSAVSRRSPTSTTPSTPTHPRCSPLARLPRPLTPPSPPPPPPPGLEFDAEGSPTSDGTLVAFEEDAIYFKPAFSPEALSPIPESEGSGGYLSRSPSPSRGSDALSLQITMDLLTKELAGSLRRSRRQPGGAAATTTTTEVPPLQTWLMIEAYERLREQVLGMHLPLGEAHALQDMFDVWLHALYRVHEGLAEGGGGDGGGAKMLYVPGSGEGDGVEGEEDEAFQTVDLD